MSNEPDLFLEADTGAIRTKLLLDRETRAVYVLSVEAQVGDFIGYCQVKMNLINFFIDNQYDCPCM